MSFGYVRHFRDLVLCPDYRRKWRALRRLQKLPRYSPAKTDILGTEIELVDAASFRFMHDEIFVREIYRFEADTDSPVILDCGANIGLSVLYFKQLYPTSRIIAFEPDPEVFRSLVNNVSAFGLSNVELHPKAVWSANTTLRFEIEGADAGKIGNSRNAIRIEAVRLKDWLQSPIDLLKLDVEGAEYDVLIDCASCLRHVRHLFVEYHSFVSKPQRITEICALLRDAGFRLFIESAVSVKHPFQSRPVYLGMDLQLNIFAVRE